MRALASLRVALVIAAALLTACRPDQTPLPPADAAAQPEPPLPPPSSPASSPPSFPPASGPASGPASDPIR